MGRTKRLVEKNIEHLCTCGAGCVMEKDEHNKDCPAREWIVENLYMGEDK